MSAASEEGAVATASATGAAGDASSSSAMDKAMASLTSSSSSTSEAASSKPSLPPSMPLQTPAPMTGLTASQLSQQQQDICRVCRCEGSSDRALFHPCICTGSIKWIHQDCLLQWLRYSKKEFCELCSHRFSFTPIYSPDMPKRLPLSIVFSGFLGTVAHAVRFWLHYTVVAVAWLGVVPLTACRIYRTLFTGSVSSILSLPLNVFSTENITSDILQGCAVVSLTLIAFIGLVWLREQILHGGGPEWLDNDLEQPDFHHHVAANAPANAAGGVGGANNGDGEFELRPAGVADAGDGRDDIDEGLDEDDDDNPDHLPMEPAAPEIDPILDPELDVEDDVDGGGDGGGAGGGAGGNVADMNDDGQWNPMEWDRAAEELTWERLLGLDGSLVFLEHVFWVVSLNTLFVLVFAFCPYHIGHFTIAGLKLKTHVAGAHFEGMLTTLCGYCVIGITLVLIHAMTAVLRFRRAARLLGLCYVVVKVTLLLIIEIVAFPVICGWWLDICSLALFDATIKDRQASYHASPMASIFIHWLIGMVYVFYFASFVILLREVLRPGVLWFLRNLNDPDFNPIQEMIHLSIPRHLRRFCASLVMFGTSILVMLYFPSRIIKRALPSFLPYQTSQSTESHVDELLMELLLLLVILPAVQDQNHTREWLKNCIRGWCSVAAWIYDIRSYLFGDVDDEENGVVAEVGVVEAADADEEDNVAEEVEDEDEPPLFEAPYYAEADPDPVAPAVADGDVPAVAPFADAAIGAGIGGDGGLGLGAAHQAMLQRDGPTGTQPYIRPSWFPLRVAGLLFSMVFTGLMASLTTMVIPVWLGRQVFAFFLSANPRIYELYTSATGIYLCLLIIKLSTLTTGWIQQGWAQLSKKVKEWGFIGIKAGMAMFLLVGVIPLLYGFLLEVVVLMPVRVPLNQSPVYFLWQDWALGAMYTKITIAVTFMGPDWWLKAAIEQLYDDGLRNMNLSFIFSKLFLPVCSTLGLALAVPYIAAHDVLPAILGGSAEGDESEELVVMVQRRIYPFLLLLIISVAAIVMQLKQFRKLYEHIKNDRYLVGRRLVNYNHPNRRTSNSVS